MKNFLKLFSPVSFIALFAFYSSSLLAATPSATVVKIFTPFTAANLDTHFKSAIQLTGECWTASLRSQRENAWRCMAGDVIYDPCFVNSAASPNVAICVDAPWEQDVIKMQLKQPLPKIKFTSFDIKKAQPWFVELSNGDHCQFLTGASSIVDDKRLNYGCSRGENFYIIGDIDRSSPVWIADNYTIKTKTIEKIPVSVAWY